MRLHHNKGNDELRADVLHEKAIFMAEDVTIIGYKRSLGGATKDNDGATAKPSPRTELRLLGAFIIYLPHVRMYLQILVCGARDMQGGEVSIMVCGARDMQGGEVSIMTCCVRVNMLTCTSVNTVFTYIVTVCYLPLRFYTMRAMQRHSNFYYCVFLLLRFCVDTYVPMCMCIFDCVHPNAWNRSMCMHVTALRIVLQARGVCVCACFCMCVYVCVCVCLCVCACF